MLNSYVLSLSLSLSFSLSPSPLSKMAFEIILLPPQARGLKDGRTEVKVKMRNLDNGYAWMWNRNQFLERKYRMQEMYQNYVEGEQWDLPQVGHVICKTCHVTVM